MLVLFCCQLAAICAVLWRFIVIANLLHRKPANADVDCLT